MENDLRSISFLGQMPKTKVQNNAHYLLQQRLLARLHNKSQTLSWAFCR
jgi:hypothetical protein